jgi:uncharacterized protein (DUF3084 family)
MYGVFLIIVLVITGGAIAFIGDRLGSKIGKKRLSIFGLRPRYTSILITILTGVCITILTFGVMAAVSQNVRTALFGMERLNRSMQETKSQLQAATDDLMTAQQQQLQTKEDLETTQDEVGRLQEQQSSLEVQSQQLQEGNRILELANQALSQHNEELILTNTSLGERNTALSGQNLQLVTSNQALGETNGRLTLDNTKLEKYNEALSEGIQVMREGNILFQAGEVIASGVIRGNRSQEAVRQDLGALVQMANANVAQHMGGLTGKEDEDRAKQIWLYQPEYDEAVKVIAASPQDMVVRIVAAGNLVHGEAVRTMLVLYKNSVIYKNREFVISHAYTMHYDNESTAEHTLMDFLRQVNQAAAAKGILPDPLRGTVGVIEGAQFYNIVHELSQADGTILLSAYARGDTDTLGPLRLDIRLATTPK